MSGPRRTRREFLRTTTGALGAVAGFSTLLPSFAVSPYGLPSPSMRSPGDPVDLTIGRTLLPVGDRKGHAVTINGSIPGPLLRFREGEDVTLRVHNTLDEDTSIHWHGIILPNAMDGVPKVTFPGIPPDETFTYRFPIRQNGTYWYHSHSRLQEQLGVYGPLVIDPAGIDPVAFDREHVILLSDWTFEDPYRVLANLKKMGGYYNFQRRTAADLISDIGQEGLGAAISNRLRWGRMRMDATDIADVTGHTYSYLMNGQPPETNWSALFRPGERVRLRLINSSAATYFDFRIPGLPLTVVQVDGQDVEPVTVDELRIAIAETYDVIVEPVEAKAYTLFAESMDRSGHARGSWPRSRGWRPKYPQRASDRCGLWPTWVWRWAGWRWRAKAWNRAMRPTEKWRWLTTPIKRLTADNPPRTR